MRRREFITLLGGGAAWPIAARAQQAGMPVVGFLSSRAPGDSADLVMAFRRGLQDAGFVEGQNLVIAFRWAEGHYDRLPELAADLVGLKTAVLFAAGGPPAALAAKAATSTIPIVFSGANDPVALGLVASLSHPGGNVTGMSTLSAELGGKTLELLKELVPAATVMAYLVDPSSPMVAGVPSPITGNFASHVSDEDLPGDAHVVVVTCEDEDGNGENCDGDGGDEQNPVLYELRRGASCAPTPTPSGTPTPSATPGGCVFGFGYWKNHPQAWPVTELQLGNVTYTQDQLLSIMHEPVHGNGLVSLAHHLITAKLNVANGADPSCIQQTIADADALIGDLIVPPVGDGFLAPGDVNALKDTLEDYNEGHLCAPSCDNEGSPTPSPSPPRPPRRPPVFPHHQRPPR